MLPTFLEELISAPEVRRLSGIRLLNALTPSLATLGEIRRHPHTLGVLFLALQNHFLGFDRQVVRAFLAAVLLHDIGTPAFGHLLEYQLRDRFDWDHESIIRAVVSGTALPENTAHQIFGGRTISFVKTCRRLGVDLAVLGDILSGSHPLSKFIFGTLDFDNLDNVVRMAWALGLPVDRGLAPRLASMMSVSIGSSELILPQSERPVVAGWSSIRRAVYEVLVFDGPTVAAQAVLSEAIRDALDSGALTDQQWELQDEELIEFLRHQKVVKSSLVKEYLGSLPELILCVQVATSLEALGVSDRYKARQMFAEIVAPAFGNQSPLHYVFVDKGAFEKSLRFAEPGNGEIWSIGHTSGSVVFYTFGRSRSSRTRRAAVEAQQLATTFFGKAGLKATCRA
jgi:HD superfamily phosphohydrolase